MCVTDVALQSQTYSMKCQRHVFGLPLLRPSTCELCVFPEPSILLLVDESEGPYSPCIMWTARRQSKPKAFTTKLDCFVYALFQEHHDIRSKSRSHTNTPVEIQATVVSQQYHLRFIQVMLDRGQEFTLPNCPYGHQTSMQSFYSSFP